MMSANVRDANEQNVWLLLDIRSSETKMAWDSTIQGINQHLEPPPELLITDKSSCILVARRIHNQLNDQLHVAQQIVQENDEAAAKIMQERDPLSNEQRDLLNTIDLMRREAIDLMSSIAARELSCQPATPLLCRFRFIPHPDL